MGNLNDILDQIDQLRAAKRQLSFELSDSQRIMPSEVRELTEAIEEIDQDIKDLEKEYHLLHAQIWAKDQR